MTPEIQTQLMQQRILLWVFAAVIAVLLIACSVLAYELKDKELDRRIARGRRRQDRMMRHPKRSGRLGGGKS